MKLNDEFLNKKQYKITISASQVKRAACLKRYSYTYVENITEPQSRKAEWGEGAHTALEKYTSTGKIPTEGPYKNLVTKAIESGNLDLPNDQLGEPAELEKDIYVPFIPGLVGLSAKMDYLRTKRPAGRGEVLYIRDYKTTSSDKYILTPDDLRKDPQALQYALVGYKATGIYHVMLSWLYFVASNPTKGERECKRIKDTSAVLQVHSMLQLNDAMREHLEKIYICAWIRLNKITAERLPANPSHCNDYGGCYYRDICRLSRSEKMTAALGKAW